MKEGPAEEVVSLMLGTAGHVDHGKTSLVRNLTGFETDRHPEERERGMSIDFAVAPFRLPDGRTAGIIDVPGHEDFIRNMVSGASAIDLLLLVIAADDAVMPQTEEHLRIAKSLGVSGVIAVVTKTDLVSADLLEIVEADVRSFLARSGFETAPVVFVSNTERTGFETLLQEIVAAVGNLRTEPDRRAFRMPIRQIFSAKGHGIVVTGVPVSGTLAVDDEAEILPAGVAASIRGIQNYRMSFAQTEWHRSSAINIRTQAAPESLSRGMVLAAPGCYSSSQLIVASFRNDSAELVLQARKLVLFHSGTVRCGARARMIDCPEVGPGQEAFVRLKLEHPVCLAAGDRFVLRGAAKNETFGGGRILSISVPRSRRLTESLFNRLIRAKEAVEAKDYFLAELLAGSRTTFTRDALRLRSQTTGALFPEEVSRLVAAGELLDLGDGGYLVAARKAEAQEAIGRALQRYHQVQKFAWGMKPSYVTDLLGIPAGSYAALEAILLEHTGLITQHGRLSLAGFRPQIGAREIRLRDDVLKLV